VRPDRHRTRSCAQNAAKRACVFNGSPGPDVGRISTSSGLLLLGLVRLRLACLEDWAEDRVRLGDGGSYLDLDRIWVSG